MERKKGFTLVELLAVISIIGVIAVIATPIVKNYVIESKTRGIETSIANIERAVLTYFNDHNIKNTTVIDVTGDIVELANNNIKKGYVMGNRDDIEMYYIYKDGYCAIKENGKSTITKTSIGNCNFSYNQFEVITSKVDKSKIIGGYRIYGNTSNNVSLGETNKTITLKLSGKNILDKSQFKNVPGLRNETEVSVYGTIVLQNEWVSNNLKPNTAYTVSFDAECTAIPSYESKFSDNFGFYLFRVNRDNSSPDFWLINKKYFTVGEALHSVKTITTPSTIQDAVINYVIIAYTNRYKDASGNNVNSTFIYKNIQIEEGSTATAYEPYLTPQEYTITLNGPLRKFGNAVDYIDSSISQIVRNVGVNADGTLYALDKPVYEYISLPSITNLDGTTVVTASDGSLDSSKIEVLIKK